METANISNVCFWLKEIRNMFQTSATSSWYKHVSISIESNVNYCPIKLLVSTLFNNLYTEVMPLQSEILQNNDE